MVDIGRATSKWSANAARAGPDYRAGISGKGSMWLSNAIAAEPLWATRIQEAIAGGWRSAGLSRAGAGGWEQAAASKGATNYVTGVQNPLSSQKYNSNFGPILSAIQAAAAALPPRGAPMSPENLARAQAIWQAAHAASGGHSPGQMQMVSVPGYTPPTPTATPGYTPPSPYGY